MILLSLLTCAASALVILLLHRVFKYSSGNQQQQLWPPSPPARPLIGHLHLLGDLPHQSLCSLSKLYGPLMLLRLGRIPAIVASSPAMAKEILQTHDLAFADRPPSAAAAIMFFNNTNLGFAPYGPYWKQLRQLFASELLSSKHQHSSRLVREEEIRALIRSFMQSGEAEPNVPIEVRASLLTTVCNINCRIAMGKRITEISSEGTGKEELLRLVEEVLHLLGVFYVGDFIPWLAWLDPHGYLKRMKLTRRKIDALMQAMIDKRREAHNNQLTTSRPDQDNRINDFLDALLHAPSQVNGSPIPDDNIKAILLDLAAGGADTSSTTVEWALADLINNPKAIEKLQDELDRVIGKNRLIEESDIPSLPYLGAVVKESMRLHPVAPLLIPHESVQECQISGFEILPKTRAYVNTWAIGRDPTIWENPLEFWPERFQNKRVDLCEKNFELLPFGYGRRSCPAGKAGLLNVQLMLGALVQGFTWSVVSPHFAGKLGSYMQSVDMSERFGLALTMAKPLCAFATPRLPLTLY